MTRTNWWGCGLNTRSRPICVLSDKTRKVKRFQWANNIAGQSCHQLIVLSGWPTNSTLAYVVGAVGKFKTYPWINMKRARSVYSWCSNMFGSAFILAGAWEGGVEILYQIFGPGLLGSWAVGNLCKSEIAQKAISLHDLAGPKAQRMGGGSQVSNFLVSQNWPGGKLKKYTFLNYTWFIRDKRPGKGKLACFFRKCRKTGYQLSKSANHTQNGFCLLNQWILTSY